MQFLAGAPQRTESHDGGDAFELFDTHARSVTRAARRVQGKPCHNLVNTDSQHVESQPGILDLPEYPLL
jgi:hypothetical protein